MRSADDDHLATLQALRGENEPGEPDILYAHIRAAPPEDETIVALQYKFLWTLYVLQSADARPTTQTKEAVMYLERSLGELTVRCKNLM